MRPYIEDTKEGYYIGREAESDEVGKPLRGPNNWPDEAVLGVGGAVCSVCE